MTTRNPNELHFIRTGEPMQSIEIDIDSLPMDAFGYADLVQEALAPLAARIPSLRATVYVYQGPSINFGDPAYCAFFGVAGDRSVLEALYSTFRATPGLRVRYSDAIVEAQTMRQYHVEDGELWQPDDGYLWGTGTAYSNNDTDDEEESARLVEEGMNEATHPIEEQDGDDKGATESEVPQGRIELPTRFRAARADASVGSISRRIEAVFGLPEGSVALRGPDKKPLRSDATIRTLRRRWE